MYYYGDREVGLVKLSGLRTICCTNNDQDMNQTHDQRWESQCHCSLSRCAVLPAPALLALLQASYLPYKVMIHSRIPISLSQPDVLCPAWSRWAWRWQWTRFLITTTDNNSNLTCLTLCLKILIYQRLKANVLLIINNCWIWSLDQLYHLRLCIEYCRDISPSCFNLYQAKYGFDHIELNLVELQLW